MDIDVHLNHNRDLRDAASRCDLAGTAEQAVCKAALTYNPKKAGIIAYFSVPICPAHSKRF